MSYIKNYVEESVALLKALDQNSIESVKNILTLTKKNGGRIFFLGVGGSAGNASHAVNDFRKIAEIECYTPTDNVSELTARTNDEGWSSVFVNWLKVSKLNSNDCLFILSVGGGNSEKNISTNLIEAINFAKIQQSKVIGIIGRDGGYTAKKADACILIPIINPEFVTPHSEGFQSVILHLLVMHPDLKPNEAKWESVR